MRAPNSFRIRGALRLGAPEDEVWSQEDLTIVGNRFAAHTANTQKVYTLSSKWIIPGLIDCHVHICGEADPVRARLFNPREEDFSALARGLINGAECIRAGVTTVRDMGTYKRRSMLVREVFESGKAKGPRIVLCGNLITGVQGHGLEYGVEAAPATLVHCVKEEARAGVDIIKIVNDPLYFDTDVLSMGVGAAHDKGLAVACHAYTRPAIEVAIGANVDTIEHAAAWDQVTTGRLLDLGIALVPTCIAAFDVVKNPEGALLEKFDAGLSVFQGWWNELERCMPNTIKNRANIGVGSDSGFPPTKFGISLWHEMQLLHDFGLPWRDCLMAATKGNAAILRRQDLGTLKSGGLADFIVLAMNPLEAGVHSLNHIVSVYKGGDLVWGVGLERLS